MFSNQIRIKEHFGTNTPTRCFESQQILLMLLAELLIMGGAGSLFSFVQLKPLEVVVHNLLKLLIIV